MKCFINGSNEYKIILLKLLAHTRDIENGKGEYALTYSILKEIYIYDKKISHSIINIFCWLRRTTIPRTTIPRTTIPRTTIPRTTTPRT